MKYFVYARKSSEDSKRQIQSIPAQLDWSNEIQANRNLKAISVFTDTRTATKPGRPGFGEMMTAIKNSDEPCGIICWKMDRLARNPIDEGAIKYDFMQEKIQHIIASDREFRKGESQILMSLEFGSATQFSIDLSRNVKRGLKKRLENGWWTHVVPLGYMNNPKGAFSENKIVPDPEYFGHIKEMWRLLLGGNHTIPEICHIANNHWGLRTKKGACLSKSTIHKLFHKPFYAGLLEVKGKVYAGKHKPMISIDEFEQAQKIIAGRDKPKRRTHENVYRGLIHCGECGASIIAEPPKIKKQKNGNVHTYHYLRCSKRKREVKCSQKCLRVENLEEQITKILESVKIHPKFHKWITENLQTELKSDWKEIASRRGVLQRQLNQNEASQKILIDKLITKVISNEAYQETKKRYETELIRIKAELKRIEEGKNDTICRMERMVNFASYAAENFENGGIETKREILRALGSNLLLKNGKLLLEAKKPLLVLKKANNSIFPPSSSKQRLEPLNFGLNQGKNSDSNHIFNSWQGYGDLNPGFRAENPTS